MMIRPSIFISYSRNDGKFARKLEAHLRKKGVEVWIDTQGIPVGIKWSTAVQQGLQESDLLIVIISPDSMISSNVEDEWQYFLDHKKPIVPILLKPTDRIHFQLSRLQYINFHQQRFEVAFDQLWLAMQAKIEGLTDEPKHEHSSQLNPKDRFKKQQLAFLLTLLTFTVTVVAVMTLLIVMDDRNSRLASMSPSEAVLLSSSLETIRLSEGGRIAFSSTREDTWQIFRSDLRRGTLMQLTNVGENSSPAWSINGTMIAFESRRDGNWEIYVMDADGGNQTNLSRQPSDERSPTWSPDGRQIAFTSNRGGNDQIYVIDVESGDQRNLSQNANGDWFPSWSPDGNYIAFTSNRDGREQIYIMNSDGSNQRNISNSTSNDWFPVWSPDGKYIAYTSSQDGLQQIYVMNMDGSNQHNVSKSQSNDYSPTWSPSGRYLAFASTRMKNLQIFILDISTGDQFNLSPSVFNDQSPAWNS